MAELYFNSFQRFHRIGGAALECTIINHNARCLMFPFLRFISL